MSFKQNMWFGVQTLRTDHGTEYTSIKLQYFLIHNGILHVPKGLAANLQMYVADRMNLTLI